MIDVGVCSGRGRRRFAALTLAAVVAVLLWFPTAAGAHTGDQSYLYLDIFEDRMEGRVEIPVRDVNDVFGLDLPQDEAGALAAVGPELARIQAYAEANVTIGAEGQQWPLVFEGVELLEVAEGSYLVLPFDVDRSFASIPKEFEVRYEVVIESIADHKGLLLIGSYWEGGIYNNEADHLLVYERGRTTQTVDLVSPSWWRGFKGTVDLGVDHIRIGTDHILFILVLLLPSVLVFRRSEGWRPSSSFASSFWRILKIATMFTVAHSITLTLAGLDVVDLPAKPVEAIIALSIIAAAVHNLRPVVANREWLIAFGFGLFHGLGFAGLLSELGLDRSNRFWSLLGFNVGVELGQAAIILLVFPILFVLRRLRLYETILSLGSVAMAVVAFGWMLERVFEMDLRVNKVVDPVLEYPRVLWFLAAAGVVAAGLYAAAARQGRLRPLTDLPTGEAGEPAVAAAG